MNYGGGVWLFMLFMIGGEVVVYVEYDIVWWIMMDIEWLLLDYICSYNLLG